MEGQPTDRNVNLDCAETMETNASIHATYVRLQLQYEENLRQNWVEQLESPNKILKQLSVAACLIHLWRSMYSVTPAKEESQSANKALFPGFVDIACGNGILVYVLHMEGYKGLGFDACRRKSWDTFPDEVQACIEEKVIIPRPFMDVLGPQEIGVGIHSGEFPENTFIISDHADELTVWTPIMAALASPSSPLPFCILSCCSRSLSGAPYRYPPPESNATQMSGDQNTVTNQFIGSIEQNPQPCSGDLLALRAAKIEEKTASGFLNSMIGSLIGKTKSVAEEVGCEVEKMTWVDASRVCPDALVGGRKQVTKCWPQSSGDSPMNEGLIAVRLEKIMEVVERECSKDGGIQAAARVWVERAKSLHLGNRAKH